MANIWKPPEWKAPAVVWRPPDNPDITLVQITEPEDLWAWGAYMGHSAGNYQKWAIDTPIWAFLTFLDGEGWPHCTIHLKEKQWLYKRHPDDDKADMLGLYRHGPVQDEDGKVKYWPPSTTYDDVDPLYRYPIDFGGRVMAVMDAAHKDKDYLWPPERALVDAWYATVKIERTPKLQMKKVLHAAT